MPDNQRPGADTYTFRWRESSPMICSSAFAAMPGSTRSLTGIARGRPVPRDSCVGRLLAEELRDAGLQDVDLDANGYVTATLPRNVDEPTAGGGVTCAP